MAYWQVRAKLDDKNHISDFITNNEWKLLSNEHIKSKVFKDKINSIQVDEILFLADGNKITHYARCKENSLNGICITVDKWKKLSKSIQSLNRGNYNETISAIKNSEKIKDLLNKIEILKSYKLKNIKITNFRLFEELEVDFNQDINVIIANNGAGKTTLLDAIAIGLGVMVNKFHDGLPLPEQNLHINRENKVANFMRIRLKSIDNLIWDISKNRTKLSTTMKQKIPERYGEKELVSFTDRIIDAQYEDRDFIMPLVIYYKTNRAVFDAPMRKRNFKKEFSRFDALEGVLKRDANFHRLFQWFDAMENSERRGIQEHHDLEFKLFELEEVRKAIESMLPHFTNPRIEESPLRFMIDKEENECVTSLNIEQLSDGYRTILAMIMDISARMAQANPHLGNKSKAIILIDELDLHLHPKWQQTILSDLRRTFPNAQFIVTTHSVHILSSIKKEKLFTLKDGKKEKTYLRTYGKSIDELLLGSFEIESLRYPKVAKKIEDIQRFLYSKEYKEEVFCSKLKGLEEDIGKDDIDVLKLQLEKLKRDKNA